MADPEILENHFPVRIEELPIRHESGKAGAFQGGNGVTELASDASWNTGPRQSCHLMENSADRACGRRMWKPIPNITERANGMIEACEENGRMEMAAGDIFIMYAPVYHVCTGQIHAENFSIDFNNNFN